jgi:hypothetical protein
MDLTSVALLCVLFIYVGWKLREVHAKRVVRKMHETMSTQFDDHLKESIVGMRLEKHDGVIYIYESENNSFICQGKTKKELSDNFNAVRPNKKGIILEGSEYWRETND